MNRLINFLGSVAYTGYFPIAPATFTSFVVAGIYWLWGPGPVALLLILIGSSVLGVPVATRMEKNLGKDPSACTIDELAGLTLTFLGRHLDAPGAWKLIIAGFFLFRFFDIAKIWPASRFESLPGGWGIVIDDLMAGLYSFAALFLLDLWIL